jgi:hypothetical protein
MHKNAISGSNDERRVNHLTDSRPDNCSHVFVGVIPAECAPMRCTFSKNKQIEASDIRGSDTRHYIRMIHKGQQLLEREASAFFLGQHGVCAALHPRHDELFALGVLAHARQTLN